MMADMEVEAMANNPYEDSLELRVLSATPIERVMILYDSAIDALRAARGHLLSGEIRPRSRAITRAVNILMELNASLNHQLGGELSVGLSKLYNFMTNTLLEANYRQTEAGLITVEKLLVSIREAWMAINESPAVSSAVPSLPGGLMDPFSGCGDHTGLTRQWSA
ncbi:MAG TPA: flagellar export chaperone FliS [Bryobacteraceae bacterium]|nr:flagellar export chaperone FliS [Bryobacteraceae bacterium]